MSLDNLLHNSCRLYPTTVDIVRSALSFDSQAIRRAVPFGSQYQPPLSNLPEVDVQHNNNQTKKRKVADDAYLYPINIALRHQASLDVVKLLTEAGPDVLLRRDGPWKCSALAIALQLDRPLDVIKTLLLANRQQTLVTDWQNGLPLHTAVSGRNVSLDVVRLIFRACPDAILRTNVRGENPVQVAERNRFCREEIVDYLQGRAYSPFEKTALHFNDSELNVMPATS